MDFIRRHPFDGEASRRSTAERGPKPKLADSGTQSQRRYCHRHRHRHRRRRRRRRRVW